MKKAAIILTVMAFLFLNGCSAKTPDFSVEKDMVGTVMLGGEFYNVETDFSSVPKISVKSIENAFDMVYEFYDESVTLTCGEITCRYEIADLPERNVPVNMYKIISCISEIKNLHWKHNKKDGLWAFSGKCSGMTFTGKCNEKGRVQSFYISDINMEFQT